MAFPLFQPGTCMPLRVSSYSFCQIHTIFGPVNPFAGFDANDKIFTLVFQLPAFHLAVDSEVAPTPLTKADDEFAFWTGSARP